MSGSTGAGSVAPVTPLRPAAPDGESVTLAELYAAHPLSLARLPLLLVDDRETAADVVQDAYAGLHRN